MLKRRYVFEETADALVARVRAAETGDDTAEKRRALALKGCLFTGLGGFILFFGGLMAGAAFGDPGKWVLLAAVVVGIGGTMACGLAYWWYGLFDLDDRKLQTLVRFLGVLRADVPSAALVRVEVDLRDYRKGVRVKKESGGWFSGLMTYGYEHTWLTLDTSLADGTRVRVSVTDHVKRKEKRKRKYTKVRERAIASVTVSMRLGKAYDDAGAVAGRIGAVAPPRSLHVEEVRGQGRVLHVTVRGEPDWRTTGRTGNDSLLAPSNGDTLLHTLRWVYRGLAPTTP